MDNKMVKRTNNDLSNIAHQTNDSEERIAITTNGTYMLPFVTQIFRTG